MQKLSVYRICGVVGRIAANCEKRHSFLQVSSQKFRFLSRGAHQRANLASYCCVQRRTGNWIVFAKVAELVDALALGASGVTRESSSLSFRTNIQNDCPIQGLLLRCNIIDCV